MLEAYYEPLTKSKRITTQDSREGLAGNEKGRGERSTREQPQRLEQTTPVPRQENAGSRLIVNVYAN
jgi:hypothetical protein